MNINALPVLARPVSSETPESCVALEDLPGPLTHAPEDGAYPPDALPAGLDAPLLGDLAEGERLFAVIDGGRVPGLADRLDGFDAPHESLLQGAAAEDLSDVAPFLADVTEDDRLLRALTTVTKTDLDMGAGRAAIYIRADGDLDALRRHLRRFVRVQDQVKQWFFFRFWDPEVMFHYLDQREPNLVNLSYLMEPRGFDGMTLLVPHSGVLRCATRTKRLGHTPGIVVFNANEFDAVRTGGWSRYIVKVGDALDRDGLLGDMTLPVLSRLCANGFAQGIKVELALYIFARAFMRAGQNKIDFDKVWQTAHAEGAMSQLDRAKRLDRLAGFDGTF